MGTTSRDLVGSDVLKWFKSARPRATRAAVIAGMAGRTQAFRDLITEGLMDRSRHVRFAAADATEDERHLQSLRTALRSDPYAMVRASAAEGLGLIGDPRAVPALLAAIDDRASMVRGFAAAALRFFPSATCIAGLKNRLAIERDGFVRMNCCGSLAYHGEDTFLQPFLDGLTSPLPILRSATAARVKTIATASNVERILYAATALLNGDPETADRLIGCDVVATLACPGTSAVSLLVDARARFPDDPDVLRSLACALARTSATQQVTELMRGVDPNTVASWRLAYPELNGVQNYRAGTPGTRVASESTEAPADLLVAVAASGPRRLAGSWRARIAPADVAADVRKYREAADETLLERFRLATRTSVRVATIERATGRPDSWRSLIAEALTDRSGMVRAAAADSTVSPHHFKALLHVLLTDAYAPARAAAADSLGQIGDSRALPALLNSVNDAPWTVRRSAAEAVRYFPSPLCISVLQERLTVERHGLVKIACLASLVWHGRDDYLQPLLAGLRAPGKAARAQAGIELVEVARAANVEQILESAAAPLIQPARKADRPVLCGVLRGLACIGNSAVPLLERAFEALPDDRDVLCALACGYARTWVPDRAAELLRTVDDAELIQQWRAKYPELGDLPP